MNLAVPPNGEGLPFLIGLSAFVFVLAWWAGRR